MVLGVEGSYLWNDYAAAVALVSVTNGNASFTDPIPPLPALIGETFTYQWFALMPFGPGVVTSDGLRVTLGL